MVSHLGFPEAGEIKRLAHAQRPDVLRQPGSLECSHLYADRRKNKLSSV